MKTTVTTHIKILGILNIVLGSIGILFILGYLAIFGLTMELPHDRATNPTVMATNTSAHYHSRDDQDIVLLGKAILGLVIFAGLAGLAVGILSIISGYGLLNHTSWCRALGLIVAVCYLPIVPPGTAVGVYGLMILLNEETITLLTGKNTLDIRPV